jgi:zinc-ribbon domain
MSPDTCPNCGADVPPKARACPECGACEQTGWSEDADVGDLGIPEEAFDYNEFVKREFGAKKILPRGIGWFWWAVSLAAIGALLWLVLR